MVEDRITDGKRIAQLLSSELTGLQSPPLDRVSVVDAQPEAEPAPDGTEAYGVAVDDERIATVSVYSDHALLSIERILADDAGLIESSDGERENRDGITVTETDDDVQVRIEYAAAVKSAVDVLVATLTT